MTIPSWLTEVAGIASLLYAGFCVFRKWKQQRLRGLMSIGLSVGALAACFAGIIGMAQGHPEFGFMCIACGMALTSLGQE